MTGATGIASKNIFSQLVQDSSSPQKLQQPDQKWKRLSIPGTFIDPCTIIGHILDWAKGPFWCTTYTYLQN